MEMEAEIGGYCNGKAHCFSSLDTLGHFHATLACWPAFEQLEPDNRLSGRQSALSATLAQPAAPEPTLSNADNSNGGQRAPLVCLPSAPTKCPNADP